MKKTNKIENKNKNIYKSIAWNQEKAFVIILSQPGLLIFSFSECF